MGDVLVRFRIHGPKGSYELEGIADTGATFTKVPKEVAELVGIERRYEVEVELADGRVVSRDAGLAEIEINNIKRPVLVTFSDENEKPLIGVTTLETLGLRVNPITRKLEPVRAIEYYV